MYPSNYDKGFMDGVTIRNIPVEIAQNGNSNVFWVNSVVGSNGNPGNFLHPFATIAYAITRCNASVGDRIFVAAGHVETVSSAAALLLNKAGVIIEFLGEGSNRATIKFGTVVGASMSVTAANVTLINPRFLADLDALTGPISISAANFTILNGEYFDAAAKATTDCIVAAATATGLVINGWKYFESTTGTQKQSNIQLNGVDNVILANIDIAGDFGTGNIENITDELLNVRFESIKLKNTNATPKPGMVLDADCTGFAKNVDVRIASGSTYVSSVAKLNWDGSCLGYNADGEGGDPIGTADSSSIEGKIDTVIAEANKLDSATLAVAPTAGSLATFVASGGTALGTALAASKSLVDAIGSNGSALTYGAGSALGAIGTSFWIKKTITSSGITFAAPVDITGVSSVGELVVDEVILKTDSTGLATGTNFQVLSNNSKGLANILVEAIANLGTNKTITLEDASVTKVKTVLETGKKLQIQNTIADGTGGGTVDIYVKFIRLAAGATIAAA